MPFNSLVGILQTLELGFIQELEVFDWFQALSEQSLFATQLGRIYNVRSLKLAYYHWAFPPRGRQSSSCFLSQLSKLGHLQKLHLSYSYISGSLHHLLRCLQVPLHTLEIRSCTLLDTDITYLSQSLHATCLRKLDLSGINLSYMVPGPLETLLAKVSGTLQHLDLNHCQLKDAHLSAILPALCRCSRLSSLGLSNNLVSRAGLLSLPERTAGLAELKRVLYPIPIECCVYLHGVSWGPVNKGRLCQMQAEMQKLLQAMQRADMQWSPPLPSPLPMRLMQLDWGRGRARGTATPTRGSRRADAGAQNAGTPEALDPEVGVAGGRPGSKSRSGNPCGAAGERRAKVLSLGRSEKLQERAFFGRVS
ncbi:PREDICTED: LOW QUALITY PROTEIN: leucine-rich repeat-containing protein 14-like [Propithecus coquereli]|uniref:LOW QUALITY PROTEIN: leucine-rich repeat-containing protein 14-like n=1 Tax=Propithecus coquereli TaxID=379532 RepID=UPI00063F7902|nr:PREDICTED: LOW QUALITY PROTEIN: leucine-rich repeat-containing protein 14-like [Propithecus coquereli]